MGFLQAAHRKIGAQIDLINTLRKNWAFAACFALLAFTVGFFVSKYWSMAINELFPEFDDTRKIIENQDRQFSEIKNDLAELSSTLSGKERELLDRLQGSINDVRTGNNQLALYTESLKKENKLLSDRLNLVAAGAGGPDLRIPVGGAAKLDGGVTLGVPNYFHGDVNTSLSQVDRTVDGYLKSGQGIEYTGVGGQKCRVVFAGLTSVDGVDAKMAEFTIHCVEKSA